MIARALADALAALFLVWRRSVTRAWRIGGRLSRTLADSTSSSARTWKIALGHIIHPEQGTTDTDARWHLASAFGVIAFASGALIAVGFSIGNGDSPATIAVTILSETAWAAARLWVLLLVLRSRQLRVRITHAFLAGLAPYALAFSPLLRFSALVLSAIVTTRGLRAVEVSAADARTATAWAFGGQALMTLLGAIARGMFTVLALS